MTTTGPDADKRVRLAIGVLFLVVLLAAAVLRLWDLDLKPLHSDEGVNGFFLLRLVTRGYYRYNPENYHGPFLYYLIAPLLWIQKSILHTRATVFMLRIMPALFGIATVALLWPMRRLLGLVAMVAAAVLIAFEPGMVYFSRTTIHEIFLVFFTLLSVYGFGIYLLRRTEWHSTRNTVPGRLSSRFWQAPTLWLVAGMLGLAGCYANKETSIITYGAFGVGLFAAWAFKPGAGTLRQRIDTVVTFVREEMWGPMRPRTEYFSALGGWQSALIVFLLVLFGPFLVVLGAQAAVIGPPMEDAWWFFGFWAGDATHVTGIIVRTIGGVACIGTLGVAVWVLPALGPAALHWYRGLPVNRRRWLLATVISVVFLVVLYSALWNAPRGLFDMFATHFTWIKRGVASEHTGHEKDFPYYLKIMWEVDAPLLYVGAAFAALTVIVRRDWKALLVAAPVAAAAWFIYQYDQDNPLLKTEFVSKLPERIRELAFEDFGAKQLVFLWTLAGLAVARHRRIGLFTVGWAGSITFVYSVVSYKTPWLVLNLTLPLALVTAYFIDDVAGELARLAKSKWVPVAVAAASLGIIALPNPAGRALARAGLDRDEPNREWVTWVHLTQHMNFVAYDDDRYELIYVQTMRDIWALVDRLRALLAVDADKHKKERRKIHVVSEDYWPLPYYVNDYKGRLTYHSGELPKTAEDIILIRSTQKRKVKDLVEGYRSESYVLRPGVVLILYVNPELWDPLFGDEGGDEIEIGVPPKPSDSRRGVRARYYAGLRCQGSPIAERVEEAPRVESAEDMEFQSPFCAIWEGWLEIQEAGEYVFTSESDDGSWVYLDGELVVDNGGTHARLRKRSRSIQLEPGLHHVRVRYFDAGGAATLRLKWRKLPEIQEQDIPEDHWFHALVAEAG